jgi:hypothetical protein
MNVGFPVNNVTQKFRVLLSRTILRGDHEIPQRLLNQSCCLKFLLKRWQRGTFWRRCLGAGLLVDHPKRIGNIPVSVNTYVLEESLADMTAFGVMWQALEVGHLHHLNQVASEMVIETWQAPF